MDSSKKLPTVGGVGVKNRENFTDDLNGWSLRISLFMNKFQTYPHVLIIITAIHIFESLTIKAGLSFYF